MALQQQQQIEAQHQLLAAKEQRLRFLRAQEIRGAAVAAEGERLRRLRERVQAQESKLRRLRALRGQADLQKSYNVTLSKFFFLFSFSDYYYYCGTPNSVRFNFVSVARSHGRNFFALYFFSPISLKRKYMMFFTLTRHQE